MYAAIAISAAELQQSVDQRATRNQAQAASSVADISIGTGAVGWVVNAVEFDKKRATSQSAGGAPDGETLLCDEIPAACKGADCHMYWYRKTEEGYRSLGQKETIVGGCGGKGRGGARGCGRTRWCIVGRGSMKERRGKWGERSCPWSEGAWSLSRRK